jgi:hypothetical protein
MTQRAHRLAEEINGFMYGDKENGGTHTIYVSPIPFDVLNKSITTGPGRPHLTDVPDAMTTVNGLATALVAGPIVGAVAATKWLIGSDKPSSHHED